MRSIKNVQLRSMDDIMKNMAVRKYILSYVKETDGLVMIRYLAGGDRQDIRLTDSMSMKGARIPENAIVKLDVTGANCDAVADFIIRNVDGMTLVED